MTRLLTRPAIHTCSPEALGSQFAAFQIASPGSTTNWPAANEAIFVPFILDRPALVKRMFTANGSTVNGNVDVGIYTWDGARIVSIGSTAHAGTSTLQFFNITDTYLGVGQYYMAAAADGTARIQRYSVTIILCQHFGVLKMASAFALPASVTFATVTTAYVPHIGMELYTVL